MSQMIRHIGVTTINESLNFQREFAPILSEILNSALEEVVSTAQMCCSAEHVNSNVLLSPNELKVIQRDFTKHKKKARKRVKTSSEQLKVAAIATLTDYQDKLLVSRPEIVADKIQRVVTAKTEQETYQEIQSAFHEIKVQHTESFVANIAHAIETSAIAVGFPDVQVLRPSTQMVRVVATNDTGQNLIAEIANDQQIDIHTELIGFTDGTCEKVMRAFDDEMVRHGVATKHKEQKPTLGVPQLPFTKRLLGRIRKKSRSFADETIVSQDNNNESIHINC